MRTLLYSFAGLAISMPSCTSTPATMKSIPPQITLPNPGIAVALRVEVQDVAHVLAHLSLTNHTTDTFRLYKPLLGEGPVWERFFYVLHDTPERQDLPYLGAHEERYLGGQPHTLIFVVPATTAIAFLLLAPGARHEVTKNLSEVFDFAHQRGSFLLAYSSYTPAMHQGKQRVETDTLDPNYPRPVYYRLALGDADAPDSVFYRKFTVQ